MSARPNKEYFITDSNLWRVPITVCKKHHSLYTEQLQVVANTAHGATLAAQAQARIWKTNETVPDSTRYLVRQPVLVHGIAVATWKVGGDDRA